VVAGQPGVQVLGGAPVGRLGDVGAQDAAARRRGQRLDIFAVGPDVADMGEGEGDDLAGVGRIGQGFLIPGQAGVEHHLAGRLAKGSDALAPVHGTVGEHQHASRAGGAVAGGDVGLL